MTSQQKSLHSTFSSKDRFERVLPSCDDVDTYTEKRVKAASSAYYKAIDLQKAAQQDFKSLEKEVLSFGSRDPSSDEGIRLQFRVFTGLQKKLEASKRSERREARCQQVGIDRNDYLLHQEDGPDFPSMWYKEHCTSTGSIAPIPKPEPEVCYPSF